jgi:hypothetical protein
VEGADALAEGAGTDNALVIDAAAQVGCRHALDRPELSERKGAIPAKTVCAFAAINMLSTGSTVDA